MPTVDHIANVSFKDHFLSELLEVPVDGSIRVNNNTFDVTFVDGKVNARFTSGNRFTNSFRTSTLERFTQMLQAQYDEWIRETQEEDSPESVNVSSRFPTATDLHATDVIKTAKAYSSGSRSMSELVRAVDMEMPLEIELPDYELKAEVTRALDDLLGACNKNNDEENAVSFERHVRNFATYAYKDAPNDGMRLAHLLARRIENVKGGYKVFLAGLDDKATRCAEMLKRAYPNKVVDVQKAKKAIVNTINEMVDLAFDKDPMFPESADACRQNLTKIMYCGRLFTDQIEYNMDQRLGEMDKATLDGKFNLLFKCIEKYGEIECSEFINDPQQEVTA